MQNNEIAKRLLAIGGESVEGTMPDLADMRQAHTFPASAVVEMGLPFRLRHMNAARTWGDCRGWASPTLRLCTGFALSKGVWRTHSWCINTELGTPTIIEPSTQQERYFGVALEPRDAERFYDCNRPG